MRTLAKTEWRNALQELKIAGRPPRVNEREEHMRRLPRNSGVDEFRYGSAWDFRVWTPTKKLRAPLGPPVPTRIPYLRLPRSYLSFVFNSASSCSPLASRRLVHLAGRPTRCANATGVSPHVSVSLAWKNWTLDEGGGLM